MNISDYQNKIIIGDNVHVLQSFPDNCINLTVTSPPYDKLRSYKGKSIFDFEGVARELYRTTKEGGVVVWVVGDAVVKGSETGTSFRQALGFMEAGFRLYDTMIYEKNSISYPSTTRYYQIFEYMFVFSKGKPNTINLIKDRKNKWAGHKYWGKLSDRKGKNEQLVSKKNDHVVPEFSIRTNIWRYNTGAGFSTKDKIAYKHPAIFPEKLAEDHILSWSKDGDVILDPFCGSGTTLKMAKKHNRIFIGIDINKEYCDISDERVELID
jgi:site-specific DNA-methyltransferase (adenine-specific)